MQDYYLKFNNEDEMWTSLENLGLAQTITDDNGNPRKIALTTLDVIGTIYKPTGNMITTTSEVGSFQYEETTPIDGFHANIRGDLTEDQQAQLPLIPKPNSPHRVWA